VASSFGTRLADAPVTKVDNGDGTFYLQLPSGASTATHWDGALKYEYDGQQDAYWSPPAPSPSTIDDTPVQEPDDGGEHGLVGSVKVDALGRRWLVTEEVWSALATKVATYDATLPAEPSTAGGQAPPQTADCESSYAWRPTSWTTVDCSADGEIDSQYWISDQSTQRTNMQPIRDTTGWLYEGNGVGANPWCQGFFIDDRTIVSAAHCFRDGTTGAQRRHAEQYAVGNCGNGHVDAMCSRVDEIKTDEGKWPAATMPKQVSWDLAVLRLATSIGAGRRLPLSKMATSNFAPEPARYAGFPRLWDIDDSRSPKCMSNQSSILRVDPLPTGECPDFSSLSISEGRSFVGSKNKSLRKNITDTAERPATDADCSKGSTSSGSSSSRSASVPNPRRASHAS
jgi:hypothetical protein